MKKVINFIGNSIFLFGTYIIAAFLVMLVLQVPMRIFIDAESQLEYLWKALVQYAVMVVVCVVFLLIRNTEHKVVYLKHIENGEWNLRDACVYVIKNKYFWITNISTILGQWSALVGGLLQFWFIYSLRMEALYGVAANVVVVGMTFGNILCPILTKKFQKRNILIAFRGIALLTIILMLFAVRIENVYVFIGAMFLRNTFQPVVDGINVGLGADIQDYHQWKYGERADSMAGVFGWFLNPINAVLGFIIPWLLAKVGFTSDWDVLFDQTILNSVFNIYTWATIISTIIMVIPFLFYDLTREKHDMCVEELQARLRKIEEQDKVESEVV